MSVLRGRPPGLASGISGSSRRNWSSVRAWPEPKSPTSARSARVHMATPKQETARNAAREARISPSDRCPHPFANGVLYQPAWTLTLASNSPWWRNLIRCPEQAIRLGGSMGATLKITCADHTSAELRALAGKCTDGAQVRRMLALALGLEGRSRSEAAALNGRDRQTLRDWVHRYNAWGMAGLKSGQSPGREPYLTEPQKAELRDLVIRGPDPATDRVVRWRCVDLRAEVARRFAVEVHESTIGKWLHQLRLTRLQPRPVHPKKDADAETNFKKTSPA